MLKYIFELVLIALLFRWLLAPKKTIVEHRHFYPPKKQRKELNERGDYVEYEEVEK